MAAPYEGAGGQSGNASFRSSLRRGISRIMNVGDMDVDDRGVQNLARSFGDVLTKLEGIDSALKRINTTADRLEDSLGKVVSQLSSLATKSKSLSPFGYSPGNPWATSGSSLSAAPVSAVAKTQSGGVFGYVPGNPWATLNNANSSSGAPPTSQGGLGGAATAGAGVGALGEIFGSYAGPFNQYMNTGAAPFNVLSVAATQQNAMTGNLGRFKATKSVLNQWKGVLAQSPQDLATALATITGNAAFNPSSRFGKGNQRNLIATMNALRQLNPNMSASDVANLMQTMVSPQTLNNILRYGGSPDTGLVRAGGQFNTPQQFLTSMAALFFRRPVSQMTPQTMRGLIRNDNPMALQQAQLNAQQFGFTGQEFRSLETYMGLGGSIPGATKAMLGGAPTAYAQLLKGAQQTTSALSAQENVAKQTTELTHMSTDISHLWNYFNTNKFTSGLVRAFRLAAGAGGTVLQAGEHIAGSAASFLLLRRLLGGASKAGTAGGGLLSSGLSAIGGLLGGGALTGAAALGGGAAALGGGYLFGSHFIAPSVEHLFGAGSPPSQIQTEQQALSQLLHGKQTRGSRSYENFLVYSLLHGGNENVFVPKGWHYSQSQLNTAMSFMGDAGESGLHPSMQARLSAMRSVNPSIRLTSGHRTNSQQSALYALKGGLGVSPPGDSLHQHGMAMDLGPPSQYGWIEKNAWRFGLAGASGEPWHLQLGDSEPNNFSPPSTKMPSNWASQVIRDLGGKANYAAGTRLLESLAQSEHGGAFAWGPHGGAFNNPLDVVAPRGISNYNYNGGSPVQNYASPSAGIAATVQFLKGSNYASLVSALRAGKDSYSALMNVPRAGQWGGAGSVGHLVAGSASGGGGSGGGGTSSVLANALRFGFGGSAPARMMATPTTAANTFLGRVSGSGLGPIQLNMPLQVVGVTRQDAVMLARMVVEELESQGVILNASSD